MGSRDVVTRVHDVINNDVEHRTAVLLYADSTCTLRLDERGQRRLDRVLRNKPDLVLGVYDWRTPRQWLEDDLRSAGVW